MKLSEMTTERATDVLCSLTPYITNILTDEKLLDELKSAIDIKDGETLAEKIAIVGAKISQIVPLVMKNRKQDLFGILGVLNDKTADEIAKQNFILTMKQVRDLTKDRELLDFFKSCKGTEGSE